MSHLIFPIIAALVFGSIGAICVEDSQFQLDNCLNVIVDLDYLICNQFLPTLIKQYDIWQNNRIRHLALQLQESYRKDLWKFYVEFQQKSIPKLLSLELVCLYWKAEQQHLAQHQKCLELMQNWTRLIRGQIERIRKFPYYTNWLKNEIELSLQRLQSDTAQLRNEIFNGNQYFEQNVARISIPTLIGHQTDIFRLIQEFIYRSSIKLSGQCYPFFTDPPTTPRNWLNLAGIPIQILMIVSGVIFLLVIVRILIVKRREVSPISPTPTQKQQQNFYPKRSFKTKKRVGYRSPSTDLILKNLCIVRSISRTLPPTSTTGVTSRTTTTRSFSEEEEEYSRDEAPNICKSLVKTPMVDCYREPSVEKESTSTLEPVKEPQIVATKYSGFVGKI